MFTLPLMLVVLASDGFNHVGESDGILIESRAVPGSNFVELRFTAVASGEVERLCERAFGTGKVEPGDAHVQARRVLSETADERVTYEQISPPLVSRRDYVLRSRRVRPADGVCRIEFEVANELAPPVQVGWVRIVRLKGFFAFEREADGPVKVTHQIHMDPGGTIPAWLAEGTRRDMSLAWMRRLIAK